MPTNSTNNMTFTANAQSLVVEVNGPTWVHVDNGGTFNSGTLALTYRDGIGNAKAIQDSTGAVVAYAAGADDFYEFPANAELTLTMSGAAGATSVYAEIRSEPRR